MLFKPFQHADMRHTARAATAQYQADLQRFGLWRMWRRLLRIVIALREGIEPDKGKQAGECGESFGFAQEVAVTQARLSWLRESSVCAVSDDDYSKDARKLTIRISINCRLQTQRKLTVCATLPGDFLVIVW